MSEKLLESILIEIREMKQEQLEMKKELAGVKHELTITNNCLSNLESKSNTIQKQTANLSEYDTDIIDRFEVLPTKEDVEHYDKKFGEHDREIAKLKSKVQITNK